MDSCTKKCSGTHPLEHVFWFFTGRKPEKGYWAGRMAERKMALCFLIACAIGIAVWEYWSDGGLSRCWPPVVVPLLVWGFSRMIFIGR